MRLDILTPDLGDFHDVPVVEIPVALGDLLREGDSVAVLESDKAVMEVPSSHAGRVAEIFVKPGDRVSKGARLIALEAEADAPAESPPPAEASPPKAEAPPAAIPAALPAAGAGVHASPLLRGYARRLGADLEATTGSGPHGRVTREDLEAHIRERLAAAPAAAMPAAPPELKGPLAILNALPDWPKPDFEKFGPMERQPLSRIARVSGPALARNAAVIPQVTNFDKADVTELEAFRKAANAADPEGPKLTILAFAVKAAVLALKAYPRFNASLDGEALIVKGYWNIGVAADTPDGLVVPVIREADRKGLREIAAEMAALAAAARAGKLKPGDMQGASFTISSLGGIGGTNFTPIVNAPEAAILGMTRAELQPVWTDDGVEPRLIQPMSLSWDHRIVDGVAAARFLAHMAQTLSDSRRLVL